MDLLDLECFDDTLPITESAEELPSAVVSLEETFPPSEIQDPMYDAIVQYLRAGHYPSFIKMTTNKPVSREEFRRRCEQFFLDKTGELIHGRTMSVHRHALRKGELSKVIHFVHEVLGHCSSTVCANVVSPLIWTSECLNTTAYEVIRRCDCRKVREAWRSSCSVDTARHISLSFVREHDGGFTIVLHSTSKNIDLSQFQTAFSHEFAEAKERPHRATKKCTPYMKDGRYRLRDFAEMEDILQKLHEAFVHSYDYDVEVIGDINSSSRVFLIRPHRIPVEESKYFTESVLGTSQNVVTLDDAARMAAAIREVTMVMPKLNRMFDKEQANREHEPSIIECEFLRYPRIYSLDMLMFCSVPSDTSRSLFTRTIHDEICKSAPRSAISSFARKRETGYLEYNHKRRLIAPSEISLGPTPNDDRRESGGNLDDSSRNGEHQQMCNSDSPSSECVENVLRETSPRPCSSSSQQNQKDGSAYTPRADRETEPCDEQFVDVEGSYALNASGTMLPDANDDWIPNMEEFVGQYDFFYDTTSDSSVNCTDPTADLNGISLDSFATLLQADQSGELTELPWNDYTQVRCFAIVGSSSWWMNYE
ncbi:unnamed protein product [Nippostrongylus brasiliensis]|uniref:Protein kinase domain-containing protein n=1 Tax=Nippostrongylus brasiliensis TaxID=27835 RepID=A0A0N4YGF7_NIPBR|nr:unnamed protein product [Nippostrongylus brasiliensis]